MCLLIRFHTSKNLGKSVEKVVSKILKITKSSIFRDSAKNSNDFQSKLKKESHHKFYKSSEKFSLQRKKMVMVEFDKIFEI